MVALGEQEQEVEDGAEDFFAAFNGKEEPRLRFDVAINVW